MAYCRPLIGQQRSGRPVNLLLPRLLGDSTQAADWPPGAGERPDGRVERLVGGGGRLDVWRILEVI